MAFDAGMLRAVTAEVSATLFGGAKVEKVCQPARDEFDLILHAAGVSRRLCFIAGSNVPHFSYSRIERENLPVPSMFCMLLRKHLLGSKLISAEQIGFERAARFTFACRDELGYGVGRTLVAEMMGKYSNLILLDGEDKIISALKIVDFSASKVRQVLPGMKYTVPPPQDKFDPLRRSEGEFQAALSACPPGRSAARFIGDTYSGISAQNAREMVRRLGLPEDAPLEAAEPGKFYAVFDAWFADVEADRYCPTLLFDAAGEPVDYSYTTLCGSGLSASHPADFGELLDLYFGERDKIERVRQRTADLSRMLARREAQLVRKLETQREELADCAKGEEYRRAGDLITENIWQIRRGAEHFTATDYTTDPPSFVTLPLDSRLSPAANAQRMYKLYTKSRHAEKKLTELIASGEEELDYLRGVRGFLERAETEQDFAELRQELSDGGYLARDYAGKKKAVTRARPLEFRTTNGYRLLCGRNNLQNEMLTLHTAARDDIWFHAKGVGGSHVILLAEGGEPPAEDYTEAAQIAAYYSQSGDALTAVDYTRVRNIRKPQGSRPGYVTYKSHSTAYVMPSNKTGEKKDG